jgi:hypothetical protein
MGTRPTRHHVDVDLQQASGSKKGKKAPEHRGKYRNELYFLNIIRA